MTDVQKEIKFLEEAMQLAKSYGNMKEYYYCRSALRRLKEENGIKS